MRGDSMSEKTTVISESSEELFEKYTPQIAEVMGYVPTNPFLADLISRAIKTSIEHEWSRKGISSVEIESRISIKFSILKQVAQYASTISNPSFYKHHLVLIAALVDVDPAKCTMYDLPDKSVSRAARILTDILNSCSSKERWTKFYALASTDQDILTVALIVLTEETKALQVHEAGSTDFIKECANTLKLAANGYLELSLRTSKIQISNQVYPYYNNFIATMLKADF